MKNVDWIWLNGSEVQVEQSTVNGDALFVVREFQVVVIFGRIFRM